MNEELVIDESEVTTDIMVVQHLLNFFGMYGKWREQKGLPNKIDNVHEIVTSMTDKHGRICRQIKHMERDDPKADWPTGMSESLMGYLVYMSMLFDSYKDKIEVEDVILGFFNELNASVEQHS